MRCGEWRRPAAATTASPPGVSAKARQRRSQAGFVVLKSPDMPSVLIELGYLSNAEDERALRDPDHLAKLAGAMVRAIDQYFHPERS